MVNRMKILLVGGMFALTATFGYANSHKDTAYYLQSCLPLETIQTLTGLPVTKSDRVSSPQVNCSYNDSEQLSKQSRVIYGRDPSYRVAFGESDIIQSVEGLGNFAEFDIDAGQLYVNVGNDGLVFEGRKGKTKLPLESLKKIAEKVLQKP